MEVLASQPLGKGRFGVFVFLFSRGHFQRLGMEEMNGATRPIGKADILGSPCCVVLEPDVPTKVKVSPGC